jgi:hypothetical protein
MGARQERVLIRRRSSPAQTRISQHEHMNFADAAFCIRIATLKNWEQGTRKADEKTYDPNTCILTLTKRELRADAR